MVLRVSLDIIGIETWVCVRACVTSTFLYPPDHQVVMLTKYAVFRDSICYTFSVVALIVVSLPSALHLYSNSPS